MLASAWSPPINSWKAILPFKLKELCQRGVKDERPKGKAMKLIPPLAVEFFLKMQIRVYTTISMVEKKE
jgi:hypothetical protein